jgi:hypothetical protein
MSFKKLLGASLWKGLLLSMLLLLLLLAAASLMLQRGLLPESAAPVMVCTAYAASVFVGGSGRGRTAAAGADTGYAVVRGSMADRAERRNGLLRPWAAADGGTVRRCAAGGSVGTKEGKTAA